MIKRLIIVLLVIAGIVFVPYLLGYAVRNDIFQVTDNDFVSHWMRGLFSILIGGSIIYLAIVALYYAMKYIIKGD